MTENEPYELLKHSIAGRHWERIGLARRAGVVAPLFSIYSAHSVGIGELPDLKAMVDWCRKTDMSVVQLLPMNDVGFDFQPYSAQSSFALEPMYLSLGHLREVGASECRGPIEVLRNEFPTGTNQVHYGVKAAKLDRLWKIFQNSKRLRSDRFSHFVRRNKFWLKDYALFKVIKERCEQVPWETWNDEWRRRNPDALREFEHENRERVGFFEWLQWQLYEQFVEVKRYAEQRGVLLMGDLPFLVSRDSADVWARQDYFKLDMLSGAPPDMFFATGQRWGMPPYHWERIARHHYDYLVEKLRYAENFYDFYRIDHVVGIFRLWSIPRSEPPETGGLKGAFDPPDEKFWEEHGRKRLHVMLESTRMVPCAEDLGVVPACSYKVLRELGIPGMDVQRWTRDWDHSGHFLAPEAYRENSVAVISTHDTSSLRGWWEWEAGTIDEMLFVRKCQSRGVSFESVKSRLFDLERSRHGRLRWRRDLTDVSNLPPILERREEDVRDMIDLYRGSHNEKQLFWKYLRLHGDAEDRPTTAFVRAALRQAGRAASILSVQLLQDWLSLAPLGERDSWTDRINFPGTVNNANWTPVSPLSLEEMQTMNINETIRDINSSTGRI